MKKFLVLLLILGCAVPVFAKKRVEENIITPMAQLEKRQFQTRTYNSDDRIAVMKALLNTLQDEGYVVYNVNSLLGFIYGVKDFDTTDPNIDISKEFGFTKSRLNYNGVKVATLETSANVTQYGNNVRVRVNFKRKLLNEYGNAQFIDDIEDGEFYAQFYEKVDNALKLIKQVPVSNKTIVEKKQTSEEVEKQEQPQTENVEEQKKESGQQLQQENVEPKQEKQIEAEETKEAASQQAPVEIKEEVKEETKEEVQVSVSEETESAELSKKELKQQKKLEKQMLKELEEQEKIQAKLLKQQEKEEAKILKELEKAKQD